MGDSPATRASLLVRLRDPWAEQWDREYERQLLLTAAQRIRGQFQEATWQAFWRTTVDGQSGKDVAQALGISVAAVYLAKSRVMGRLKEAVRQLQAEILGDPS